MDIQPIAPIGQQPLTGVELAMLGGQQTNPQQQQQQMAIANELRKKLPEVQALGQMNDAAAQNNAFAQLHTGTG